MTKYKTLVAAIVLVMLMIPACVSSPPVYSAYIQPPNPPPNRETFFRKNPSGGMYLDMVEYRNALVAYRRYLDRYLSSINRPSGSVSKKECVLDYVKYQPIQLPNPPYTPQDDPDKAVNSLLDYIWSIRTAIDAHNAKYEGCQ